MKLIDTETQRAMGLSEIRESYRKFARENADERWCVERVGFDSAFHWHLVDAVFRYGTLVMGGDAA